jgi:dynein heavy chain 1
MTLLLEHDVLFKNIITEQSKFVPFILLSDRGYDYSNKVEALAKERSLPLISVALGSAEAQKLAESTISHAMQTGGWILIKNAHLDMYWFNNVERFLSMKERTHESMRLFITAEIHPSLPINFLRKCRIFVFSPPNGIRAGMQECVDLIPKEMISSSPVEKQRILMMMVWLHAIIMERLRYVPLGWTKQYDFNLSDFEISVKVINSWLSISSHGRTNIAPENIPWQALQSIISQNIYGGKIDREIDLNVLHILVNEIFNANIFNADFNIVPKTIDSPGLIIPDGSNFSRFVEWIDSCEMQSPAWLGLAIGSDTLINSAKGITLII